LDFKKISTRKIFINVKNAIYKTVNLERLVLFVSKLLNLDKLEINKFLLFDGAMGTMLQRYGLKQGELPESYNIKHPDIIRKIHREYIEAGCDIITTNTFGANRLKLKDTGYSVKNIIKGAIELARASAESKFVALDIGPIGRLMEPIGTLSFEEAYDIFKEQVEASEGADLILIETMSDIYEAKAAVLAAKENSNLPVICTMTLQKDGRTLTGTDALTMVNILQGLGVDGLGINCSLGPKEMLSQVEEILKYSKVPVLVQPNAGLPTIVHGETVFNISATEFSDYVKKMAELGVTLFGGCCGTDPSFIAEVKNSLSNLSPIKRTPIKLTAVSSSTNTVVIGEEVKIIGERINPTGKKKLKEALKSGDMEYILEEAVKQTDAGAHILDVNVGLPEINEAEVMVRVIKELQSITTLPLQIDSSSSEVIEAAVRAYSGKPLINSVNGKTEIMDKIFPIAKKYGAIVVGLTLDENGIPSKAEDRVKIAERIIKRAEAYGIDKSDIIIDCLVLTASAQQKEVKETIKAVRYVKENLGVKTTLGVSNVSFGLPERELINRTFLAAALEAGLDAPILNPLSKEMMDTINGFNVLWNNDKEAKYYISLYSSVEGKREVEKSNRKTGENKNETDDSENYDLQKLVIKGLKKEAKTVTKLLLKEKKAMEIVEDYLIPSLDIVGKDFEEGRAFLPQLILSAETVKEAFEVIKEDLILKGEKNISKGKIIIATVKGDIHDIGKNIVKILLQNYGFEVIDLGKDVHENKILEEVKKHKVTLVGLSALMTTTVKSMEDTIKLLRENSLNCKVFVGGAVLNQEYADMIDADYYAKDAKAAVTIAQEFYRK
jgi:5-methyltetrahydrofolate--homocysteine methyltransferase